MRGHRIAALALAAAVLDDARAEPAPVADAAECKKLGGTWSDVAATGCMLGGRREGIWTVRYPSGQVMTRESYTRGERSGPSIAFHTTCRARERGKLVAGTREGPWATWARGGERVDEGSYKAGARDGVWKFYEANVLTLEGPMVADSANGTFTEWFASGTKWRTVELKNGSRTGPDEIACEAKEGKWLVDHGKREEGCSVAGDRDGNWRGYFDDGKVAWRTVYEGDSENGERIDYHPTGEILRKGNYVKGIPDGKHEFRGPHGELYGTSTISGGAGAWAAYYANGRVAEQGTFKGGSRDGLWSTYDRRGQLLDETTWSAGSEHGPHRELFPTGELMAEGDNEHGHRAGIWKAYFTNGNLSWTGAYDDTGRRTGYWFNGNFNGTPAAIGLMANDQETGGWMVFSSEGALAGTGPFQGGRKHGKWREWWPSGERWRDVVYVDGREEDPAARACMRLGGAWLADPRERALGCQVCRSEKDDDVGEVDVLRTGPWTWWHANGVVERRGVLEGGKREGRWQWWFDNGALMLEGEFKADREQGPWIGRYRDGNKRFEGGYQDGAREGLWTTLHPDGKIAATGSYAKNQKVGHWVYNHASGAKKEEGDYEGGAPSGTWTTFRPDGKRESSGRYVEGKRDGEWTWWRADGSVWRTARYAAGKEVSP